MTLKEQIDVLRQQGYSEVLAQAKVVHDIVLLAIARCGFAGKVSVTKVRACLRELIYDNKWCRANSKTDVVRMLGVIFTARPFVRRLANAKANWLQVDPSVALSGIMHLVNRL